VAKGLFIKQNLEAAIEKLDPHTKRNYPCGGLTLKIRAINYNALYDEPQPFD
jgi:hypothetical protein